MKNTLINLGLTAGAVFVLYKLFKKDDLIPMNKPLPQDLPVPAPDDDFSNFSGLFKKKRGNSNPVGRQVETRCETNLERLARLFPDNTNYEAELGKAFQQQGNNFNSWAKSTAKPCFVVGTEQGGLQSGGISFDGSPEEIVALKKKAKEARLKNLRPILVPTQTSKGMGRKKKALRLEGLNFTGSRYFN